MKVIPEVALDLLFPGLCVPREMIKCREAHKEELIVLYFHF